MARLTAVDFNNPSYFKVWNYKLYDNPIDLIISCLAILLGNYEIYRKRAALLILKIFVRNELLEQLLRDNIEPFERSDPRVKKWASKVVSKGKCEKCNSTENLEAHHIIYWSEFLKGRLDPDNGMCLCNLCHAKMHEGERCEKLILGRI